VTTTAVDAAAATIRWSAWFGDRDLPVPFPPGWTVRTCAAADAPDLADDAVLAALRAPLGSPPLHELARGRRAPCIVIDDLSRPTPGDRLLPLLLDELATAGIPAEDVLVLVGVANHRTLMRADLKKKLGERVLRSCRVRNHFSWRGTTRIGTTSRGTPIDVNDDFLAADLRILVGSIVPHPVAGFSGGAKMVLPAVSSNEAGRIFHTGVPLPGEGVGTVETLARRDAEEAARAVGVDFIVNTVPTTRRGIGGVVAGDLVAAHRAGVAIAQRVFDTTAPAAADVCLLSCYPKDNEFLQYAAAFTPLQSAPGPLVRAGGTVVMATAGSEGPGFHSLFGPGMAFGGPLPRPPADADLVLFCPGVSHGDLPDGDGADVQLFTSWTDTVSWLTAKHGPVATASVFPTAVTQLVSAVCDR
jgi:nickel-dependent lactate racemase